MISTLWMQQKKFRKISKYKIVHSNKKIIVYRWYCQLCHRQRTKFVSARQRGIRTRLVFTRVFMYMLLNEARGHVAQKEKKKENKNKCSAATCSL